MSISQSWSEAPPTSICKGKKTLVIVFYICKCVAALYCDAMYITTSKSLVHYLLHTCPTPATLPPPPPTVLHPAPFSVRRTVITSESAGINQSGVEGIDLQSNPSDIGCGSMREPAMQHENQSHKVSGIPAGEQVTIVAAARQGTVRRHWLDGEIIVRK